MIVDTTLRAGESAEGIDKSYEGSKGDRRTGRRHANRREQLRIGDDDVRSIISCANGKSTYLISQSTKAVAATRRAAALERARGLTRELAACLKPLAGDDGETSEALQTIFDFIERQKAEPPRNAA